MNGLELLYRGSLKSCNYQCSYCPFSKHRMSERELRRDREQWEHFAETVWGRAGELKIRSLLVAPYGEALIHPWYWEGLGRISSLAGVGAVGAQTNLSFPAEESLECFQKAGGDLKKLHLWATFHPEMTTAEEFSEKCGKLAEKGVRLCAGAVGAPQNAKLLKALRRGLPKEIYLWVNRMDGLKRPYTREETETFLEIDPYFLRELSYPPADPGQCRNRLFAEGNGRLRVCNISRYLEISWDGLWETTQRKKGAEPVPDGMAKPLCGQKRCSCYLAYGGREDFMNQILFGPHPVFRVPRRAKAVFLDIMGTLILKKEPGQERIPPWVRAGLEGLHRDGIPLFFATTLPYHEAKRRCREIWHLFSGGVFAGGAHLVLKETGGRWEAVQAMEKDCLAALEDMGKDLHCRVLPYRSKEKLYKVTLLRPDVLPWREEERRTAAERLREAGIGGIRIFPEENCLQIVSEHATKAEGVRRICGQLHISLEEAAAAGDSPEDAEMLKLCRRSFSAPALSVPGGQGQSGKAGPAAR